jgi:uncharacterized membrane protein HdeD (DUF308 family)
MIYYPSTPQYKPRIWPFILWGLATIAIGVFILVDTHDFAQILAYAFGFYLIISGAISLALAWRTPQLLSEQFVPKMLVWQGILSLVVGILTLALPVFIAGLTWITMLYLIAAQFLVTGVTQISVAWRVMHTGYPLGVSIPQFLGNGVAALLAALVLLLAPRFIGIFLLRLVGIGLILVGVGLIVFFVRFFRKS